MSISEDMDIWAQSRSESHFLWADGSGVALLA